MQIVLTYALAGGLEGEALGGLEDEDGGGLLGETLGNGTGDRAADLFITIKKQGDWALVIEVSQDRGGSERHEDACLHVEDSWAGDLTCLIAPGHGFEGSV